MLEVEDNKLFKKLVGTIGLFILSVFIMNIWKGTTTAKILCYLIAIISSLFFDRERINNWLSYTISLVFFSVFLVLFINHPAMALYCRAMQVVTIFDCVVQYVQKLRSLVKEAEANGCIRKDGIS